MKILVTGANGQLGQSIQSREADYPQLKFIYTDVQDLDITDLSQLETFFKQHKPDYLINCAAYTAVDQAEEQKEMAFLINATAPGYLAEISDKYGCTMIHISTDYVFNGRNHTPYLEEDKPDPESVYGQSKLAGEEAVISKSKSSIVIRTSWLYSEYGNNFVKTILRLAQEKENINIIFDQVGTPSYAGDLAIAILHTIQQEYKTQALFHFSNEGVASWYDFSLEIINLQGTNCEVRPIFTHEYPLPAPRPFYSLMSKRKFTEQFNYSIPHWKESLKVCLKNLNQKV